MSKSIGTAVVAKATRYENKGGKMKWLRKGLAVDIISMDKTDGLYMIQFKVNRWVTTVIVDGKYLKDVNLFGGTTTGALPKSTGFPGIGHTGAQNREKASIDMALDMQDVPTFPDPNVPAMGDRNSRAEGKLKYALVDYPSMEGMVRVLMFGAVKYQPYNWQKGMPFTELLESMQRHLAALMAGEEVDPESGEFHEDHIHCNAMFLSWMRKHRPDLDDRNKHMVIDASEDKVSERYFPQPRPAQVFSPRPGYEQIKKK